MPNHRRIGSPNYEALRPALKRGGVDTHDRHLTITLRENNGYNHEHRKQETYSNPCSLPRHCTAV